MAKKEKEGVNEGKFKSGSRKGAKVKKEKNHDWGWRGKDFQSRQRVIALIF